MSLIIGDLKYSYIVIARAFVLKAIQEGCREFQDCDLVISSKIAK
ncbi:hypothetical protein [Psychroserpens burtonensis]|nr:hypothetical protein [Psychroserpens burtonensis]